MAATDKCLAESNKPRTSGKANNPLIADLPALSLFPFGAVGGGRGSGETWGRALSFLGYPPTRKAGCATR